MEQPARRRLAAILMADVVDYGRHMGEDESATIRTLKAHRAVFAHHIQQRYGRVVDAKGDAIMAAFESVVDAVAAAVEIQRQIDADNEPLPDLRQMQFRIGINLGDIVEEPDSIYGDGVTIAARLETLAESGGICISRMVHDSVRGKLPLEFDYLGEHEVKTQTVRAYRVVVPEGAEMPAPGRRTGRESRTKSIRLTAVAVGVAVLIGVGAVGGWLAMRPAEEDPILAMPTGPTIAVLPFVNMSGDPEQEYFSDGITEQIITEFTRFSGLRVLSRNSTFQYKGKATDVREIGRELGAQYVVEGSVRSTEDRVRVTAQLIDAESGAHLWAETFERNLSTEDIFAVQDAITGKVVAKIADLYGVLNTARLATAKRQSPENLDSYRCVLRALEFMRALTPGTHLAARDCLERAVEAEPNYSDTWAWLALINVYEFALELNPRLNPLDRAEQAAQRAVALDPGNQTAQFARAYMLFFRRDEAFFDAMERVFALNPNNAVWLGVGGVAISHAGRWQRGLAVMEKAIALTPNPPGFLFFTENNYHFHRGEYDEALAAALKIDMPGHFFYHVVLAESYAELGRIPEAEVEIAKVLSLFPDFGNHVTRLNRKWVWDEQYIRNWNRALRKAGLDVPPEDEPYDHRKEAASGE